MCDLCEDSAEQEWAERWMTAWDRLDALGVVGPEDQNLPLSQLERIVTYLGPSDD